mmetsp:Transcript_750/g.1137  ORF Transcript_750/g.1137 Transcript_750/m.1137 type:complete len:528 (+) Transcript_750:190-1773(+)
MDVANTMYKGQQLLKINQCRIALKVTYLSDIASIDGKRILLAYYQGRQHLESGRRTRLQWSPVGQLPKSWWDLWQEFLTCWCGTALHIPVPLRGWYEGAEILTLHCFYMHERRLIMQYQDSYHEFLPYTARSKTRFHPQSQPFHDLHLLDESEVVDIAYKSSSIFVLSKCTPVIITTTPTPEVRSFRDLYRDLSPELQRIIGTVDWPAPQELQVIVESISAGTAMGVSDGSVRTKEKRASQAWIIQAPDGSEIKGKGPVDGDMEARTIHRAELQGQTAIFLMLSLFIQIFGGKIISYCDNQTVVRKLQHGWKLWRYRHTKGPDGDLQALLRKTLQDLEHQSFSYNEDWVKGHQDDDGEISSMAQQVQLNVRMDGDTKEAYHLPMQWQTQAFVPVLRAEGCAVYIGDRKITSNLHRTALERWHEEAAREYLNSRHGFNAEIFSTIYWQSLRFALTKFNPHRRSTAVKALHRHLPTQDKLFKHGRIAMTSVCPGCLQCNETNMHVYCCPNLEALKKRKEDWHELWKQLH